MRPDLLKRLAAVTQEEQALLDGRIGIDPSLYNLQSSMIVDAERLLEKGRLIELRPHTRFVHFPCHTHNYVEVVYMCSGQTQHYINGTPVRLAAGELMFLSQKARQEILPADETDIAVNFIILPEFFDRTLTMLGPEASLLRDFLVGCLRGDSGAVSYLQFQAADLLPVQNLMENLVWMLLEQRTDSQILAQTTMGLVFLHLLQASERMQIGREHYAEEVLLTVYRFIDENYKTAELSELARRHHWNLYWLSRLIKKSAGRTYTELLQEKRLQQAGLLLTRTTLSVTDICLAVGYNNFSYFYQLFRRHYGMSPKEYRGRFSSERISHDFF